MWAMLNGEPAVGVAPFQITPGLDEGDLYCVDVACAGGTALTLLELQVEGGPALPAPDVVTSVRMRFGAG